MNKETAGRFARRAATPAPARPLGRPPRATLAQLRTFEAVASLRSVTRAARALHVTQPTVSAQLRELAQATGVALVQPAGRGIAITEAGEALASAARDIFARWAAYEDEIAALAGLERGVLRIAGVSTTEYFIAALLKPFAQAHPGIEIDLAVDNRGAVIERLRDGADDLALMMMPPEDMALERLPVLDNPLVLIGAADHPWAPLRRVPLARLAGEPLIAREPGSGTRAASETFLAAHGLNPRARMTLGSNEAVKHAVAAGLGVAVISRLALAAEPRQDGVAILPVAGFPLRRRWQLVWRSDRALPRAARAFLRYAPRAKLPPV